MNIKPLVRKANYYETDQMGIIHHSNYIRWFEEARVDALAQLNLGYAKLEAMGIVSPVLNISCTYKHPVKFDQTVDINVKFISFSGVRLEVAYEIFDHETGQLCTTGTSSHGFINAEGRPIRMKKEFPEVYEILKEQTKE